jgi:hypothetical protein
MTRCLNEAGSAMLDSGACTCVFPISKQLLSKRSTEGRQFAHAIRLCAITLKRRVPASYALNEGKNCQFLTFAAWNRQFEGATGRTGKLVTLAKN